jgi:putative sigma-54 modulation protein
MPVEVDINVHNLELNDRLQEYVTKKVGKLDRYLDVLEDARVDLSYDKTARSSEDRQIAQLTVRGKSVVLRAEERSDDIFASFDEVMEKIHRQIERYKGRHWRNRGDGRSADELVPPEPSEAEPETVRDEISRRKRFLLVPMDENEAIEQMILLGQENFFVFLNAGPNQVSILYRRRDGTLGLIETEVA